jgi:hypothetical protein
VPATEDLRAGSGQARPSVCAWSKDLRGRL